MANFRRLKVQKKSERAIQVQDRHGNTDWIPLSECTYIKWYRDGGPEEVDITIPDWLANMKRLEES